MALHCVSVEGELMRTVWNAVGVGLLEGLGIVVAFWCFHQLRKYIYYRNRWLFFSIFDDRSTDLGVDVGPVTGDGRQLYWAPVESFGADDEPFWAYVPLAHEKPSYWKWIRESYKYAGKYQQWKPREFMSPERMQGN